MQTTCPICGGAIDLADEALFLKGCPHCRRVLPRGADAWELLQLRAQNERLRAALEVATRGWVRKPDFGDPHCRYCGGTGVGVANYAHAEDCPVRVYDESNS